MKKSSNQAQSRAVTSNQQGIHSSLEATVRKHLSSTFRKPCAAHNIAAFEKADAWLKDKGNAPLILDSYCGVGESTWHLAQRYPDCAVIGIDKSAARLAKHHAHSDAAQTCENYLLVQADVDDFWRLAQEAGWQPLKHFLLYPNPWPKSSQLKLRIHGSPLLPTLLKLGGGIEVRSNWPLYIKEFAQALRIAGIAAEAATFSPEPVLTPFERKYHAAGQTLWRCQVQT